MKKVLYNMLVLLFLFHIHGIAQSNKSVITLRSNSDLWEDLGDMLEPIVLHEECDTRNGLNSYGNENNDLFYSFKVFRPTVFFVNFNGSELMDIEAHLFYFPLDDSADAFVEVGDPITPDNFEEKFLTKGELFEYCNLALEENIYHGFIGTLFLQVLQPGYYVLHSEGASSYGNSYNGIIKSNIYINPLGTSMGTPMDIGYFSNDFSYNFSGTFDFEGSQELFFLLRLSSPMAINVLPDNTEEAFLSLELMSKLGQNLAAGDELLQIKNVKLEAGEYIIRSEVKEQCQVQLGISGNINLLEGDGKETPIDIENSTIPFNFETTFNTANFTDIYHGRNTSDVFHRLVVNSSMDLIVAVPSCLIEGGLSFM